MKEGMIVENMGIPEVPTELMDTTHLLTQKEIFMHRNITCTRISHTERIE
jgi:hypothetical protein